MLFLVLAASFIVEPATDIPLDVGARVQVETSYRLQASASVGVLPPPYLDMINATLVGLGAYNQATADLIENTLDLPFVWRIHVGYRPFQTLGLYAHVGTGHIFLGGGTSTVALAVAASGRPAPNSTDDSRSFDIRSRLHMFDVEIGWRFAIGERLSVRTAIGGAFTFAAKTKIERKFVPAPLAVPLWDRFQDEVAVYLDDIYTSAVHAPVITVSVGYRF